MNALFSERRDSEEAGPGEGKRFVYISSGPQPPPPPGNSSCLCKRAQRVSNETNDLTDIGFLGGRESRLLPGSGRVGLRAAGLSFIPSEPLSRLFFFREGMESQSLGESIWNLTSSWSCPALPLLQIGEKGLYSLQGHEELVSLQNPMLRELRKCYIWISESAKWEQ